MLGVGTGSVPLLMFLICSGLGLRFSTGGRIGVPLTDLLGSVETEAWCDDEENAGGDILMEEFCGFVVVVGGARAGTGVCCFLGERPESGCWWWWTGV